VQDRPDYEAKLQWTCESIWERPTLGDVSEFPSIQFGVKWHSNLLLLSLPFCCFRRSLQRLKSIQINGLVDGREAFEGTNRRKA
jgi:hypothetical protein